MKAITHIEQSLAAALALGEAPGCPPKLANAVRHAVFPGGARIRPQLCLAVAHACGNDDPLLADAAAVAIELLHCASLVHDDLPCFDDAPTRRGRASVHWAYGESLAVLAGDALIVLAFQTLGLAGGKSPQRMGGVANQACRRVTHKGPEDCASSPIYVWSKPACNASGATRCGPGHKTDDDSPLQLRGRTSIAGPVRN